MAISLSVIDKFIRWDTRTAGTPVMKSCEMKSWWPKTCSSTGPSTAGTWWGQDYQCQVTTIQDRQSTCQSAWVSTPLAFLYPWTSKYVTDPVDIVAPPGDDLDEVTTESENWATYWKHGSKEFIFQFFFLYIINHDFIKLLSTKRFLKFFRLFHWIWKLSDIFKSHKRLIYTSWNVETTRLPPAGDVR